MVQATNFPERARALADEIAAAHPHLVGLQEVTLWRSRIPADTTPLNADHIEYDFLATLLAELADRGKAYAAVATVQNADAEAPGATSSSPTGLQDIRITDHDVIIARTDLPATVFSVAHPQSGKFAKQLSIPNPILGRIGIPRGWAAVDVSLHGDTIRVVSTHLEALHPDTQVAQGHELLTGPLNATLPTVLLGDLNSAAEGGRPGVSDTPTYRNLLAAGFVDAWTTKRGNEAGFTWGQAEDLRNPTSTLTERIDFILTRGGLKASSVNRVGDDPADRTPSGLWPSDHAGVWAVLHLKDD
jgi:endonuclease/exonuclease/phosphatase family metal-dependent hydrolase